MKKKVNNWKNRVLSKNFRLFPSESNLSVDSRIYRYIMRKVYALGGGRGSAGVTWCNRRLIHILNTCRTSSVCAILVIYLVQLSFVHTALSGINHNEFLAQLKVPQCRKDCLDKVSITTSIFLHTVGCIKNPQNVIVIIFLNFIFIFKISFSLSLSPAMQYKHEITDQFD